MKSIVENNFSITLPVTSAANAGLQAEAGNLRQQEVSHSPGWCEQCNLAVILVADHFNVPISEIMRKTRSSAPTAFARQIAIYIAHTTLSVSYKRAAMFFGRDRTTIAHACRTVEDRRDDMTFDARVSTVENLVREASEFFARSLETRIKSAQNTLIVEKYQ